MTDEMMRRALEQGQHAPLSGQARLTEKLADEWFEEFEGLREMICNGCGAIVVRSMREKHWRFHLQATGNVHL